MPQYELGKQLISELMECNPTLLNDLPYVRDTLIGAAKTIGAKIVGETCHQFEPYGITGTLIIAESHITIHTWPEYSFAYVDIFTCGQEQHPSVANSYIAERLEAKRMKVYKVIEADAS